VRELHVVALSEDGRHLVLGPSKTKGSHRVRLDARLLAAVRGELDADHAQDLSPKEIQARLRAGESAEQIARSAVALGKAVDAALAEHARPGSAEWSARREDDGRWRVQVAWTARGRARTAAWRFDPHTRLLDAEDPASAALGHVGDQPAAPRRTASKPARPAPARKAAPVKAKAAPKAAKAAPKPAKAAPNPSKAKTAPAKPAKAPVKAAKAAPKPAKAAPKAVKAPRPRLRVVPDPAPVTAPRPAKRSTADEREGVRTRASVPAWADVLLGTTPSGEK
jgi:hypothetical protein